MNELQPGCIVVSICFLLLAGFTLTKRAENHQYFLYALVVSLVGQSIGVYILGGFNWSYKCTYLWVLTIITTVVMMVVCYIKWRYPPTETEEGPSEK